MGGAAAVLRPDTAATRARGRRSPAPSSQPSPPGTRTRAGFHSSPTAGTSLIATVVIPATFLVVWLLAPFAEAAAAFALVAAAAAAVLLELAGLESLFNAAKIVAFALFGFWFLQLLEQLCGSCSWRR